MASKEIAALSVSLELNSTNFTKQLQTVSRAVTSMEKDFKIAQKELESTENKFKTLDKALSSGKNAIEAYAMKIDTLTKRKGEANKVLDKAKDKYEELGRTLDKEKNKLDSLEKTVGKNSSAYEKQRKIVDQAEKAYEKQAVAVGKAEGQVKRYESQIKTATESQKKLKSELDKLQKEFDSFRIEKASKKINEFIEKTKTAQTEFSKLGKNLKDIGRNMSTSITLPIAAVGGAVVKLGADFDSSISNCASISEEFANRIQDVEEKAREMGAVTSFGAKDAADGLSYMALAGWDVETSLKSIEPVLRLAEAGAMDLGLASDLVTDSMSALGYGADDLQGYLDKVAKTATISNTSIEQLMDAILNVGGTARTLNIPMSELNAYLGVLADNGIKGSLSGTKLNSILTRMTAQSKVAQKAWKDMGVEVYDSDGKFRGLTTVLQEANKSLSKMSEEEQQVALKAAVGTDNINAFKFMLDSTNGSVQEYTKSIDESNGKLEEMAKMMKDNLGGDFEEFLSALEEVGLTVYKTIEPALRDVIQWATEFLGKLNSLSPEFVTFITIVGGIFAALGPVLMIVGQVIIGIEKLWKVVSFVIGVFKNLGGILTTLKGAFIAVKGAVVLLAGALSLPVSAMVAIIAAITALIAGGIYLIKNWDEIIPKAKEFGEKVKTYVSEKFEELKENLKEIGDNIKQAIVEKFGAMKEKMKEIGDGIKQSFVDAWEGIKTFIFETIPQIIDNIGQWFAELPYKIGYAIGVAAGHIYLWGQDVYNFFTETIPMWIESISNWFSELPGKIDQWLQQTINNIVTWCTETKQAMDEKISEIIESVSTWFSEMPGKIEQWLNQTINNITTWCTNMYNKMSKSASDAINAVNNWFLTLPQRIADWLNKTNERVRQWGNDMATKAKKAAEDTVKKCVDGFNALPGKIKKMGEDAVRALWNGISSMGSWISGKISSFIKGIADGFSSVVNGVKNAVTGKAPKIMVDYEVGQMPNIQDNISSISASALNLDNLDTNGSMYRRETISPLARSLGNEMLGRTVDGINSIGTSVKSSNNNSTQAILLQILQAIQSDQRAVEVPVYLDGKQIARASAKYMNNEIDSINRKKLRLAGV